MLSDIGDYHMKKSKISWATIILAVALSATAVYFVKPENKTQKEAQKETAFERVMRTKTLRCGYFIEGPLTMKDPKTGKLHGIVVDLTESLAKDWGLKVDWAEEINASTMIEGLNTSRYDALCASIWQITSRTNLIDHSKPYVYTPIGAYVRKDDNRFSEDLSEVNNPNTTIVGIDGDGAFILAKKRFPKAKIKLLPQFSSHAEMLLNIDQGKGDIAFSILPMFTGYDEANPGKLKNITIEKPFYAMGNSFAFKKGEYDLKAMFDTAIDTYIQSGELKDIVNKWEKNRDLIYLPNQPYKKGE